MKKTTVAPWSETETRHLSELLRAYPEYADRTICNQFRYYCPHHQHSEKAVRSKINTLRPNKCKSKWNAIAHTRLAQMIVNKNTYEDMAVEFNTSVAAITHQIHRIKNLGLIDKTPGRQVNLHNRNMTRPLPKCIEQTKQLNIDFSQEDAIANVNKLSTQIRAIDTPVEDLMSQAKSRTRPATITEVNNCHWIKQGTTQELVIHSIVQVLNKALDLLVK